MAREKSPRQLIQQRSMELLLAQCGAFVLRHNLLKERGGQVSRIVVGRARGDVDVRGREQLPQEFDRLLGVGVTQICGSSPRRIPNCKLSHVSRTYCQLASSSAQAVSCCGPRN